MKKSKKPTWEIEKIDKNDAKLEKDLKNLFNVSYTKLAPSTKSLPTKGHAVKMGYVKTNKKLNKSKKFFEDATIITKKTSKQEAKKKIFKKEDNLSKKIKGMVVEDNSLVQNFVPDIYRGALVNLKTTFDSIIKEVDDGTRGLFINYSIRDADTKNLSKNQRRELSVLSSFMENINVEKPQVIGVIEAYFKRYILDELHKYFEAQKDIICQAQREEFERLSEDGEYIEPSLTPVVKEDLPESVVKKYKYIKEEMNNIFFDNLGKSLKDAKKFKNKRFGVAKLQEKLLKKQGV